MKIDVSFEEAEALLRLIECTLPEIRDEVYQANSESMRQRVTEQERLLGQFRDRLDGELARAEVNEVN